MPLFLQDFLMWTGALALVSAFVFVLFNMLRAQSLFGAFGHHSAYQPTQLDHALERLRKEARVHLNDGQVSGALIYDHSLQDTLDGDHKIAYLVFRGRDGRKRFIQKSAVAVIEELEGDA